jgi:hypothetical protein
LTTLSRLIVIVYSFVVFILQTSVLIGEEVQENALLADFVENASAHWPAYVKRFDSVTEIKFSQTSSGGLLPDGPNGSEVISIHLLRKGPQYVSKMTLSGRDLGKAPDTVHKRYNAASVTGDCGDYRFSILDFDQKENWILEYVGKEPGGKGLVLPVEGGGIYLPGVEVPFTCLDPSAGYATPLSASTLSDAGRDFVEVNFRFSGKIYTENVGTAKPRQQDFAHVNEVAVVFDPSLQWLPRSARVEHDVREIPTTSAGSWEYTVLDGMPIGPKSYKKTMKSKAIDTSASGAYELMTEEFPDSRFRLPYYGLPEFNSSPPQSRSSFVFYLLLANGLFLLGIGAYLRKIKSSKHKEDGRQGQEANAKSHSPDLR